MDRRQQIGLIFTYNENWIGGTYYILNLVNALNLLDDKDKPVLCVISEKRKHYEYLLRETQYPYARFIRHSFDNLFVWKTLSVVLSKVLRRSVAFRQVRAPQADVFFPVIEPFWLSEVPEEKKIYWIPDFQENDLPELFSEEELIDRKSRQVRIAVKGRRLVLSSEAAGRDFRLLYPFSKTDVSIVPFAVFHPSLEGVSFESLKVRFDLEGPYFYCPNQFWVHKNHRVVIEAVAMLQREGIACRVLFSGKEYDHRNQGHIDELKKMVKAAGLEGSVSFLGFLDRRDQLQLMNHATAIIQPSFCEGWSTVVEDAKALGKWVIASSLDVHREQLPRNAYFFDPRQAAGLAHILQTKDFPPVVSGDYAGETQRFAGRFLDVIRQ